MPVSARTQSTTRPGYQKIPLRSFAKQWVIAPPDNRRLQLARALKVSPLLAQVLINRGITDTQAGATF
ncbi:MAG: hypothetical protein ACYSSO_02475, partial [Planctomycetota bacterium]